MKPRDSPTYCPEDASIRIFSRQFFQFHVPELYLVALGFEANVASIETDFRGVDDFPVDRERAGIADASDLVSIPLACRLHAICLHLFLQVETLRLAVDWCDAEDVAAAERCLRLVPDGTVKIVAKENAAVVLGVRRRDRRKAPLHVEGEIAELMVEAQPLVAAVAIANNLVLGVVDMPLRNIADRLVGRNGNPCPDFMLRIVVVRREKIDGLGGCRLCTEKHWDGRRMSSMAARKIAHLQKFKFIRCSSAGFMQPEFEGSMRESNLSPICHSETGAITQAILSDSIMLQRV